MPNIPQKVQNFRVYSEGTENLVGVADVELPTLEPMSDTVSGAGILGELDVPILGHFGSMQLTLNWRTLTKQGVELMVLRNHYLDIRGAIQIKQSEIGFIGSQPVNITVTGTPKNLEPGKFQVSQSMESKTVLEISKLTIYIDSQEVFSLDKENFVYRINGIDQLLGMRAAMGMV